MFSDDLPFWSNPQLLLRPTRPWELVKIGNMLLDLQKPLKIIGRLNEPLLEPTADQKNGYVPYLTSCTLAGVSQRRSFGSAVWPE
jgi:hypothetical protein